MAVANQCKQSILKECGIEVDRSMIKKVVMTIPYNASNHTITDYLCDNFEYSSKHGMYTYGDTLISYKSIYKVAGLIYKNFYRLHPNVANLSLYFKE